MSDLWPEVKPPTTRSIVREWLEAWNRGLVGTRSEELLVKQLEKANEIR